MSHKVECPSCLGTGENISGTLIKQKVKPCLLCKGKGNVPNALAEDYVASINIIQIYDDDFLDNQY